MASGGAWGGTWACPGVGVAGARAGGGTCLPPQEDEAAAAAAGVAGRTEPTGLGGGHCGLRARRLSQRPGSARAPRGGHSGRGPGHAPPTRDPRGPRTPLCPGGAVHAPPPARCGPGRAEQVTVSRPGGPRGVGGPVSLCKVAPGLPTPRRPGSWDGDGSRECAPYPMRARRGAAAVGVIVLQLCAPGRGGAGDVEGSAHARPARARSPVGSAT